MQEQVINTLEGGLITDMDPQYQPQGSYRSVRNMKLLNNGGSNYSLVSDTGMLLALSIPRSTGNLVFWEIIGWEAYEDLSVASNNLKVVVFLSTTNAPLAGWGQIGIFDINPTTNVSTYRTIYSHEDLNFNSIYSMNGVMIKTIFETEDIIRVYWTDNNNEPKVLNLALYNEIASGSIVAGKYYMVLDESVTYNAVVYGVGLTTNIFLGTATTTYIGSGKVVEYIPLEQLKWTPNYKPCKILNLPPIPNAGSILCGSYGVAVRLKYKNEYKSPWTPVQTLQQIYQENPTASNYQEVQGDDSSVYTSKTLRWRVNVYDENYDSMDVVMVRATGENVFESPEIIYSGDYIVGENVVSYSGVEEEQTLTSEELVEILVAFKRVGSIENTKNRLFAGNIIFNEKLPDLDLSNIKNDVDLSEYVMPHDAVGYPTDPILVGHTVIPSNVTSGNILANGRYLVGGTGNIEYPVGSGRIYYAGDIFKGIYGSATYTATGTVTLKAVSININYLGQEKDFNDLTVGVLYFVDGTNITHDGTTYLRDTYFAARTTSYTSTGNKVYDVDLDIIDLANDFWDHKGIVNGSQKKSFMTGTTQRIGIMPFDLKGNPMEVVHLFDYEITTDTPLVIENYTSVADAQHSIRAQNIVIGSYSGSGITLDLNPWVNPNGNLLENESLISGFSIVVGTPVKNIIAKGMCFEVVSDSGIPARKRPEVHVVEDYDSGIGNNDNKYLAFVSPDLLLDNSIDLLNKDLELVAHDCYRVNNTLYGTDPKGILEVSGGTRNEGYYHKLVQRTSFAGMNRDDKADIDQVTRVNLGDISNVPIDSQNNSIYFNNVVETGTFWDGLNTYRGAGGTIDVLRISNSTSNTFIPTGGGTDTKRAYCAIRNKGGDSFPSYRNTIYKMVGHYQPITQEFLTKTQGYFGGLEFHGGDSFLGLFDYTKTLMDESEATIDNVAFAVMFPCESRFNFNLRRGRHIARDGIKLGASNPNGVSSISPENLIFDNAYKPIYYLNGYPGKDDSIESITEQRRAVYYSDVKSNGELIDKWRKFRFNNFNELDSYGGPLMALKSKGNYLFAFQRRMVVYLPVNQQAAISESFNQIFTIGVGGVIDRYDNIDSFLGLEDKASIVEVPDGLVYFNRENQAIVYMQIGSKGAEISSIKQVKEVINDVVFSKELAKSTTDLNSDNAVVSGYDPVSKEVYMTFKASDITGFTLTLNDQLKMFTGIYDMVPHLYLKYRNMVISYLDLSNFKDIANNTPYVVGDMLKDTQNTGVYVCILSYTSGNPAQQVSTDTTRWKRFYIVGQVYIHNRDTTKTAYYYGRSYNEEVEFVVNSENNNQKLFDSYVINGNVYNGENEANLQIQNGTGMIDEIATNTTYQDRAETPFDVKWRNNAFIGTYQTDNADTYSKRLRDKFLKVKLIKKNFVGNDPTVSVAIKRKIVSLITKLRKSY